MFFMSNWRRHVDSPVDEFGFFKVGHGVVAPLELDAGEAVAIFERRNVLGWPWRHAVLVRGTLTDLLSLCNGHGALLAVGQSGAAARCGVQLRPIMPRVSHKINPQSTSAFSASSSSTFTPNASAFVNLLPAFSPATR